MWPWILSDTPGCSNIALESPHKTLDYSYRCIRLCIMSQALIESESRHGQRATFPFAIGKGTALQLPASLRGLCDLEAAQAPSLTGVPRALLNPLSNLYLLLTARNSFPRGLHNSCTWIHCWKRVPLCTFCLSGLRTLATLGSIASNIYLTLLKFHSPV